MRCAICGNVHTSAACPLGLTLPQGYLEAEKDRRIERLERRVAALEAVLAPMADGTVDDPRDIKERAQLVLGWTMKNPRSKP